MRILKKTMLIVIFPFFIRIAAPFFVSGMELVNFLIGKINCSVDAVGRITVGFNE